MICPTESAFKELHREFQSKRTDLVKLQNKPLFTRYVLIRSLDNAQMKKILIGASVSLPARQNTNTLYLSIFMSPLSNAEIIDFIHMKYPEVKNQRSEHEEHLANIVSEFGEVKCGVRNDNLNDVAKELIRDKSIKNYHDLQYRLEGVVANKIKGYIEWQYFNQATNDLLEHYINDHEKVIPTLRKITYVDFFIACGSRVIPFDLKITHISDDYFDLLSKGLVECRNGHDDYEVLGGQSELEKIKEFYKDNKKAFNLPNYSGFKKLELINNLKKYMPVEKVDAFYGEVLKDRLELINQTEKDMSRLVWWNYKYQGERLFKNNNRFFVFLVYNNSFEDGRPLKRRFKEIGDEIRRGLDAMSIKNMHEVNYSYEKDVNVNGNYTATTYSILVRAEKTIC